MEREILLTDEIGVDHRVKYLDENRVTVETFTKYTCMGEDYTESTTARIRIKELGRWPLLKGLQRQIIVWHNKYRSQDEIIPAE